MPINFNLLTPAPMKQGVIANLPSSGGGDSGLGGLLEGLTSFAGAIGGMASGGNAGTALSRTTGLDGASTPIQTPQQTLGGMINTPTVNTSFTNNVWGNASKQLGFNESNPILKDYLQKANPNLDPVKTPWCAGYVGSVLNSSGLKGTGSLSAKSYLNYGTPTTSPSRGDIVVLNRGNDPKLGHVGFYAGVDKAGNVQVLGGNQGNSVSIKSFPSAQVVGYRTPPSGEQVQQFAQQNKISNPQQLSNLTKGANPGVMGAITGSRNVYQNNPVMGDIAAAQAILESGMQNGKGSKLALESNNYFGIKGKGTAGSAMMSTKEFVGGKMRGTKAAFAANASPEDSFKQHAQLMNNPRYEKVLAAKSPEEAAVELQRAGYATDPQYAKKLIDVYNTYVKPHSGSVGVATGALQPQGQAQAATGSDPLTQGLSGVQAAPSALQPNRQSVGDYPSQRQQTPNRPLPLLNGNPEQQAAPVLTQNVDGINWNLLLQHLNQGNQTA